MNVSSHDFLRTTGRMGNNIPLNSHLLSVSTTGERPVKFLGNKGLMSKEKHPSPAPHKSLFIYFTRYPTPTHDGSKGNHTDNTEIIVH